RAQHRLIEAQKDKIADAARRATDITTRLATATEELAAQIEESSRGTENQKLRLAETATASEQMNSSILEVARNSGEAAKNADQAKSHAETGQVVVSETVQAIETVRTRSEEMATTVQQLGEQASGIGNIIGIISDIADQTNLLALNAAIEAARAGDAGRGFAVVADEVRKLAEKTMTATKEVEQAITAIQQGTRQNITLMGNAAQSVQQTVDLTGKAGDALRRIVEVSADTADMIRNIATAAEEQSTASEQITRSTDEISLVATETADAMNQSAEAVSELARMAEDLRQLIQSMRE
ncbi:MAG: chemotaxis protein, partial [Deltaproteobacteria bacterium]|nr:chemotaxis protein [Deltaproteobacteria bacterium]